MDRRSFLSPRKKAAMPLVMPPGPPRTFSGLVPYTGTFADNELQHLLKRTMFGSTKADLLYFKGKTLSAVVDELLTPTAALPAPPLNDYSSATVVDADVSLGQTWVGKPTSDGTLNSNRRASFKKWWAGRMINQDRSIREKLTLFWANHFGTETADIIYASYVYDHNDMLRKNALGNFKSLVKAVTIDAGMLRYLNGYVNTATAPDENYGRELQELFTIGKGLASSYTEDDVKAAARVLTGWRINGTTFAVYFDATRHDTKDKQFSSFYNATKIAARTGANGALETDDLITMIFQQNEVARYICRRLYRWFVYYKIDDATEMNVIQPLANIFRSNNYEIKPVLAALFKSEHFFDVLNQGCIIKSPVDHIVSCLREFNVVFPDAATDYAGAYVMWNYIRNWFATTGQDIGDPPNVSGWVAYYQMPQFHELWLNSDTLPKRNKFTDTMILTGYSASGKKIVIDAVAFTRTLKQPDDPNLLLDEVLGIMFRVPMSATFKQTVKQQILLSNQVSDHYWTDAWTAYLASPTAANLNIVNGRLKTLYQYLMSMPEYQLS